MRSTLDSLSGRKVLLVASTVLTFLLTACCYGYISLTVPALATESWWRARADTFTNSVAWPHGWVSPRTANG